MTAISHETIAALREAFGLNLPPATVAEIVDEVARRLRVRSDLIVAKTNVRIAVRGRAAAMWTARHVTNRSLSDICRRLGSKYANNGHVLIGRAVAMRDADPAFRALTDDLVRYFAWRKP